MSSELLNALQISASGMKAQGARIRVLSENVANASTTGEVPGAEPYRRQTISFKNELDKGLGIKKVEVDKFGKDYKTPFETKFEPGHPAADIEGYVLYPNFNPLIEIMDVREAQRSYQANLGMIEQSRTMITRTIDLLRA